MIRFFFVYNIFIDMRQLIKKLLRENLGNSTNETTEEFYNRFEGKNVNPDFLKNSFKNPDFELRMTHDGGVKQYDCSISDYNKCETNTFRFLKNQLQHGVERYYPVSGWAFLPSTTYFEHFWVYDEVTDLFLEITPFKDGKLAYAYGGVINKNVNNDILNANSFSDIDFLRGKTGSSLYQKHMDQPSNPKFDAKKGVDDTSENMFNYIMKNPNYSELQNYIKSSNIDSIYGLKPHLNRIKNAQETVRNNRDFNYYETLIKQINSILRKQ